MLWVVAVAAALVSCTSSPSAQLAEPVPVAGVPMLVDPSTGEPAPLDGGVIAGTVELFLATDRPVASLLYALGDAPPFATSASPTTRVTLDPSGLPAGPARLTIVATDPEGTTLTVEATFEIAAADAPAVGDEAGTHPPSIGDPEEGETDPGPSDADEPAPSAPDAPPLEPLAWAPPVLTNPITIHVGVTGGIGRLDTSRDYVLVMPQVPRREGLVIDGGRNVVLIGGEISIPHQGTNPSINQRRALHIANATGTVHVEGLLMHGDDISEGVQTRAPDAIVQLQNLAILNVHARDQVRFTDNHPDVIQTWGSVRELRVDRLTGETDYQGLFFKADYNGPHGPVHLRNVNMRALPTARYLFWTSNQGGGYPTMTLDEVWVAPAAGRTFSRSVWPESGSVVTGGTASWPNLPITGVVRHGLPPGGDFVPAERVGIGYVSPGYR